MGGVRQRDDAYINRFGCARPPWGLAGSSSSPVWSCALRFVSATGCHRHGAAQGSPSNRCVDYAAEDTQSLSCISLFTYPSLSHLYTGPPAGARETERTRGECFGIGLGARTPSQPPRGRLCGRSGSRSSVSSSASVAVAQEINASVPRSSTGGSLCSSVATPSNSHECGSRHLVPVIRIITDNEEP